MSESNKLLATDAELLARLTARTRSSPADFTSGREFLEREFSYRAIRTRDKMKIRAKLKLLKPYSDEEVRAEKLRRIRMVRASRPDQRIPNREINRKAREEAKRVLGHSPVRAMLLQEAYEQDSAFERKHGRFVKPRWAVLEWVLGLDWMMSREHAEAAILVAVFFYDCASVANPAHPPVLQRIPWGGPDSGAGNEILRGRWIYLHAQGYPAGLIEIAQLADARMSSGEDAPQRADTTKPGARKRRAKFEEAELTAKLLQILKENPNVMNKTIAARLGVSEATVSRWAILRTLRTAFAQIGPGVAEGSAFRDADTGLREVDGDSFGDEPSD